MCWTQLMNHVANTHPMVCTWGHIKFHALFTRIPRCDWFTVVNVNTCRFVLHFMNYICMIFCNFRIICMISVMKVHRLKHWSTVCNLNWLNLSWSEIKFLTRRAEVHVVQLPSVKFTLIPQWLWLQYAPQFVIVFSFSFYWINPPAKWYSFNCPLWKIFCEIHVCSFACLVVKNRFITSPPN